jgi:hypothetical protein
MSDVLAKEAQLMATIFLVFSDIDYKKAIV